MLCLIGNGEAHLLLLHKSCVGHIINNILSKDRRRQDRIYLLRIDILQLGIEYELITFGAKVDGNFAP